MPANDYPPPGSTDPARPGFYSYTGTANPILSAAVYSAGRTIIEAIRSMSFAEQAEFRELLNDILNPK